MITKLGIGIVTQGDIKAHTACCLITALRNVHCEQQMLLAMGCYIHINRDIVVKQAIENNCSHLLFVDSDVIFDHLAIKKLVDHDLDIVGGRYNKRILPIQCTVTEKIDKLSPVHFVPTGFLLIKVDVFKKIGAPYFSFDDHAESEDMYFCQKAIKNGYKVMCDPTIQIGHIGDSIF